MIAFAVAVLMPGQMMTVFAATARIAFSDPSASVGSEISVNMKITSSENLASADVMLSYDSNALEFISGTNAEGGAGAVRVHGDAGTPNTGTLTYTLKFRALTAGSSKITVSSQEIYDSNSQIVTVDRQGDSTVTANASASASKDVSLKSLQVSPGTLAPEFSPEVDTYAVTVGTDVDKLVISAECSDENANKVVSGNENLQMGENRVSLKVIAQDGETSKEYVIVVTKAEGGASAASGTASQFKMRVSERVITVLEPDESVEIPQGFKESTIKIDGHQVKGWVWGAESEHQYCVVYGMNEAGEKDFYRYDIKDTERTIQRYFQDPVNGDAVSKDVYDQLASTYDELLKDFRLFKILLIAAIVIAVVLLILLIVALNGKKQAQGVPERRERKLPENKHDPEEDGEDYGSEDEEEYEPEDESDYGPEEDEDYEAGEEEAYGTEEEDEEEEYVSEEDEDYVVPEDETYDESEEEEPQAVCAGKDAYEDEPESGDYVVYQEEARQEELPQRKEKRPAERRGNVPSEEDDFEIFDL